MVMINKFVVSLIMIFILFISSSTAYTIDEDLVYFDDAYVYLSAYPHTINSSGWVYFNFTSKVYTGDVDFCLGYDSEVVKPKKHELYNPHWVNWTTNHQAYFHNVSSITQYNGDDFDFGNSYNTYQRQVIYDQCINHREFESIEYEQTTANCSFDSFSQDGSNYTIFWHTNHSRYELYSPFPQNPSHVSYNFQGMTDWYYIQNAPIVQNHNYQMRVWIEIPISLDPISSKYFFAIKPSGETIHQSITNGHFYYLDPWYQDSGYAYRKEINITGESGAGTHYQVNFTIGNASGGDFNLSGHSINFPSDVRFADDDGSTALNYWIEDETVDPIIAWVNVTDDLNTSQDIYVYYGKSGATTQSDGDATFLSFDDFNYGKEYWTQYASNPVLSPTGGETRTTFSSVWKEDSTYHMYYGYYISGTGHVGHATSDNGQSWTKDTANNPVLSPTAAQWDRWGVRCPRVWKEGSEWKMIYTGGTSSSSSTWAVGLATSDNGTSWTKSGSNPVIGTPHEAWGITKVDSTYYLWANSGSPRTENLYTSTNLTSWTADGNNPIFSDDRYCADMFKVGSTYYLLIVYGMAPPAGTSVFELYSDSSPTFYSASRTYEGIAVVCGDTDEWDDYAVDTAFVLTPDITRVISTDDEFWMYYAGDDEATLATGLTIESTFTSALAKAQINDFTDSWTQDVGSWTCENSYIRPPQSGIVYLRANSQLSLATNFMAHVRAKVNDGNRLGLLLNTDSPAWETVGYQFLAKAGSSGYLDIVTDGVNEQYKPSVLDAGSYVLYTFRIKAGDHLISAYHSDGTLDDSLSSTYNTSNVEKYIAFYANGAADAYVDWIFIHKYNSPEPAFASAGAEESQSHIPPNPTTLQNTTGAFWVNYTWQVGSGNVTDYYNVSWNNTWHNDTVNTYMNDSVGASNWANITVWAYNSSGDGTLSAGNVSDEVQVSAADTTFTVTLPGGYSYAKFEPSNSTHKNCTPNGQTDSVPFYNVTNTGNVPLDIRMGLNATVTNIDLKADTDNNPSGSTTITTSLQTIQSNLAVDSSVDIWLWSDFDHAIEQTTNKTLEINVTQ